MNPLAAASLLAVTLTLAACAERASDDDAAPDPVIGSGTSVPDAADEADGGDPSIEPDTDAPDPVDGDASGNPPFDTGDPATDPADGDASDDLPLDTDDSVSDPADGDAPGAPTFDTDDAPTDPADGDASGTPPFDTDDDPTDPADGDAPGTPPFDTDDDPTDPVDGDASDDPLLDPGTAGSGGGGGDGEGEGDGTDDPLFDPSPDAGPDAPEDAMAVAPAFPGRPDAARLYAAMTLVFGNTLLDLNRRLTEGSELTAQQEDCLGAFEPGFGPTLGEPALAIDCTRALATEPFAVYVARGAFARTDACLASLAAGSAIDCVLVVGEMNARTRFVQTPPARRPFPEDGSGIVLRHEIDAGVFEVADDDDTLGPDFVCAYDVATGTRLPTSRGDCERLPLVAADHMDALIAEAGPQSATDASQDVGGASSRSR